MTNRTLQRNMFTTGCLFAALSVILGAFGAHKLKTLLSPTDLATFETGVRYQFMHALAILLVWLALPRISEKAATLAFRLFVAGIILFSFSLYFLASRSLFGLDGLRWIGAITPFGGLGFIAGWLILAFRALGRDGATGQEA